MIIKNLNKFNDKFFKNYTYLYDTEEDDIFAKDEMNRCVSLYEEYSMYHVPFKEARDEFVKFRKDYLTSDRECAAFVMTMEEFDLI